jgi:hypothetical protein
MAHFFKLKFFLEFDLQKNSGILSNMGCNMRKCRTKYRGIFD